MAENRIYRTDPYRVSNTSKVIGITDKNGFSCIACEASVFFPEGGGQPSDTGTVSVDNCVFNVIAAYDDGLDSVVWHATDAPSGTFRIGDMVELTIDWDKRFCNMQRHCGEHMLSGTLHSLFGGVNRGFHMGEDYITIDIDMDGEMLTDDELDLAERTLNEAIWADLPVSITYFDDYESSLVMPVRKKVPHEGKVSVVTVGDLPDPYDCIACCGTHPSSSGQVGLVAIYKHEPNKGMNRIYFDCGIKAKEKLSSDYRLLTEIANRNSCSTQDILHKLDVEAENIASMKLQIAGMTAYIKESEKPAIVSGLQNAEKNFTYTLDLIPVDDLLKLGFAVINEVPDRLLVLVHPSSCTVLLFSSSEEINCGEIIKEKAPVFNGRGGGRNDNARAIFPTARNLNEFVASL